METKKKQQKATSIKTFGEYVKECEEKGIYYHHEHRRDPKWHEPKLGHIHASSVGYICTGKESPKDFFKRRPVSGRASAGTAAHHYLEGFFESVELPISIEIGEGVRIIGRADLITPRGNVGDIKTCEHFPAKPYREHTYQLHCYMQGLKKRRGWIYMVSKIDYHISRDFPVDYEPSVWREIKEKVINYHNKVKELWDGK